MSDHNSPTQPPPESKWRPIALTITWALFLGAGSCFGASIAGSSNLTVALIIVFFSCVIVLVVGLIWAFVTWVQGL